MTRYVFIGAGAVGSALGGSVAAAGAEVVLVGRQAHVDAITRQGLRIRTPHVDERVEVTAVAGPDDVRLRPDDVLVLTTKTQQAEAALAQWADAEVVDGDVVVGRAWELLPVCTATNGISAESMALRWFRRVYAVCVWMPVVFLEPGEVIVRVAPQRGIFHVGAAHRVGEGSAAPYDDVATLATLQRDWSAARCQVVLTDAVMAWKARKLRSNLGNSVQALLGEEPDVARITGPVDAEAREVLGAAGVEAVDDATERAAREGFEVGAAVPGEPERMGGSSWQSLVRGGGSVETDYLNGEIARLARIHGLAAPLNERLAFLARRAARERWQPGDMTVDQLVAELGL